MLLAPNNVKRGFALFLAILSLGALALLAPRWREFLGPVPDAPARVAAFFLIAQKAAFVPGWLYGATSAMFASAIAALAFLSVALLWHRGSSESSTHLGCSAGAAAAAGAGAFYFFVVPTQLVPDGPLELVLHLAMYVAYAWALVEGLAFSQTFPRPVDIEALLQCMDSTRQKELNWLPLWLRKITATSSRYDHRLAALGNRNVRRLVQFFQSKYAVLYLALIFMAGVLVENGLEATGYPLLSKKLWGGIQLLLMLLPSAVAVAWAYSLFNVTYRTGLPEEREKILWVFWGSTTALYLPFVLLESAVMLAVFGFIEGSSVLFACFSCLGLPAALLVMLLALGLATFYQGALDPRLAITRTSVIGFLSVVIPPTLLSLERVVDRSVTARLPLPEHFVIYLSVGLTVVLYRPVSHLVGHWLVEKIDMWLPASALAGAERAVAVVGFADLSGYTALSAENENAALTHASALYKAARTAVAAHRGRFVKTLGDAVLWESAEAMEALALCRTIRAEYGKVLAGEKLAALPLHFALHRGEVVRPKDGDVLGSTVNIASRLLGIAQRGEIVVSDAVAAVLVESEVTLRSLGPRALKNVPAPVNCFVVES